MIIFYQKYFFITTTNTTAETTTAQPPEPKLPILDFRVPNDTSVPACLKVNMSAVFKFSYVADYVSLLHFFDS